MSPERSDSSETPRSGIARFLRGGVTDRFLGGVGFSAAAVPIAREGNIGDVITRIVGEITGTMPADPPTTTLPALDPGIGRYLSEQITQVVSLTLTIPGPPV